MPRKVFTAGEILTAANLNDVSDATVMVFDDATARTTAIPTPVEGMVTYLSDEDEVQVFDGSAFKAVGPGKILQVVSTTKTNTFTASVAPSAFSGNVTDLEATITPSSTSSKILVQATVHVSSANSNGQGAFRLMRGATAISVGDAGGTRARATSGSGARQNAENDIAITSVTFLDSPASTSALTYGVQIHNPDSSNTFNLFVNRSSADTNAANVPRPTSSVTLMEVAG